MYNIIKKSIKRNFAYMLSAALIISTNVNIMVFANVADNVQEKYSKDLADVNLLSGDENAPDGLKIPEEDDKSVDTQDNPYNTATDNNASELDRLFGNGTFDADIGDIDLSNAYAVHGYTPRTTNPGVNGRYYRDDNPFPAKGQNCTWYAFGRAYEILGRRPDIQTYPANANQWWGNNINKRNHGGGYPYGQQPRVGAIACWANGQYGHVAIVEKIENGIIYISDSSYGMYPFRYGKIWNLPNFQGYIYIYEEPAPPPKPPHVHNGDKVVLVKAPTAEEDGIRELRCTEDNELFRREVIPKIPDAGVEEGYYRLKVDLGGKHVATTQNKLYGNCWDIQLNANPLEKSQIWKIIPRGSGEYRIESFQNPGFSMDSVGGSLKKENIGAALNHELPNQKWHIVKNGDYYRFVVSSSWYTLDCNQNTNNTAYTWEDNKESGCQKFTLERIKPVELLNRQLSSAMLGNQYSEQLLTAGDYVDVTKESGELPPGLELNGSGLISGVPAKEGNYTFTVRASNILGDSVHEYNINVNLNAYNVNYNNNGHGTNVTSQKAVAGTLINAPQAPVDENYNFGGWYKEAECVNMWNFAVDVMPNSDLTLFAKWTLKSRGGGSGRSSGGGSGGGSGRSSGGSGSGSSGGSVSSAQGKLSSGGEWLKDSKGWWFKNRDGSYPKNAWKSISGLWYFFNSEGYMHTGWLLSNGVWYYLNGSGSGVEGKMITGWQWINKKCYYFDVISGKMSANTTTPDGYTVNADGAWTVNGSVAEQK